MERITLAPGAHINVLPAEKFNRCRISINFIWPAAREWATAEALLPLVLERGYQGCPDMTELSKKLARLYGAALSVDGTMSGQSRVLTVSLSGIRDAFALAGEPLSREYADIAFGTAFEPYRVDGVLDAEAVAIEKEQLRELLEGEINEKRSYCIRQARRRFYGDSPAGIERNGYLDEVDGLTPSVSLTARVSRGGSYETNISVSGKNAYYFRTNDALLERGRALNIIDENQMSFVCWISSDMVESFFYGVDPIGETLYINGVPFLVAGLLSEDGDASVASLMSGSADILIPYSTALKMNNTSDVTSFTVYLADGVDSEAAASSIEASMDAMFSYEEDCFTVTTMSGIEDTMEEMLSMMTALLAGIASIALVVGGIGIMNMMLTSVTERTTEIGLKKALGALPWQIQLQFLMESFLLSLIGGLAGVALGLILSFAMCRAMSAQFVLSVGAIALGVGFSAAVGVLFGWAPARKASRLNPIDALRSV